MASNTRTAKRGRAPRWELTPGTKKALIAGAAGVVVLAGGFWAFEVLTAPPKPNLKVAKVDEVVAFLAHPRGFSRMSVEKREQFLVETVQQYGAPERAEEMNRALAQMSSTGKQTLLDGVFEIGKDKFVKASEDYVRLQKKDRAQFVDHVIRDFEALGNRLRGTGGGPALAGGGVARPAVAPAGNLADIFKDHIPTKSDVWAKAIVDRTTPSERAKAKPLMDDLVQRADQLHNDPRARADFAARFR